MFRLSGVFLSNAIKDVKEKQAPSAEDPVLEDMEQGSGMELRIDFLLLKYQPNIVRRVWRNR